MTKNWSARIPALDGRPVELLGAERIALARLEEGVVFLLLADGERLIYEKTLNELEDRLLEARFYRVSRQALINLAAVESYRAGEGGGLELRLAGGYAQNVSRRRARYLKLQLRQE